MERLIKGIWIPIEIWQAEDLCWNEKILIMEIDSFTSRGQDCYFSNEYIAGLLNVKENTASILVKRLADKGYIRITRFDGRHRYLESCIEIQSRLHDESKAGFDLNQRQGLKEIKGAIYNKPINKTSNKESARFVKPSIEEVRDYCAERGNTVDAVTFWEHYESNGWRVGNSPMKDWKAAVRTWERRQETERKPKTSTPAPDKSQVVTDVNKFWTDEDLKHLYD